MSALRNACHASGSNSTPSVMTAYVPIRASALCMASWAAPGSAAQTQARHALYMRIPCCTIHDSCGIAPWGTPYWAARDSTAWMAAADDSSALRHRSAT
jgi:hypothetical protein